MPYSFDEVVAAYRKAKVEAYYDPNLAYGEKFATFEQSLLDNLTRILEDVNSAGAWARDIRSVGGATAIPRDPKVPSPSPDGWHFYSSDPTALMRGDGNPIVARYRRLIDPTVEALVVSTLWVITAGGELDKTLSNKSVFANRVDRRRDGEVNLSGHKLFRLWSEQYRKWQDRGLSNIRWALDEGKTVVVVNTDVENFFPSTDASFALRLVEELPESENKEDWVRLTAQVLQAIATWNAHNGAKAGLPIGLPASGVLANLALANLDADVNAREPIFYGRYVDDIFLAYEGDPPPGDSQDVIDWVLDGVPSTHAPLDAPTIYVKGDGGDYRLSRDKTSVFVLFGEAGLDLLDAVEANISARASEQRLRPALSDDPKQLAERALVLSDKENVEVTELKQGRTVSLRRAAFGQIIRLMELYESDLPPEAWKRIRSSFYGIVQRHVVTPTEVFIYFKWLPWLFGLMVSSKDVSEARSFLAHMKTLREATVTDDDQLNLWFWENMCRRFIQQCLAAFDGSANDESPALIANCGSALAPWMGVQNTNAEVLADLLVEADWSRRSYADLWLEGRAGNPDGAPAGLLKPAVFDFQQRAHLAPFSWIPISFPTRPLSPFEISVRLGQDELTNMNDYLDAFLGYRRPGVLLKYEASTETQPAKLAVGEADRTMRANADSSLIAVASFLVSREDWENSLSGPTLTLNRYNRFRRIFEDALRARGSVDYLVLPELCIPRRWMRTFSEHLVSHGISLIAGVEYQVTPGRVRNQCLMALHQRFAPGLVVGVLQAKTAPAPAEEVDLQLMTPALNLDPGIGPSVVMHDGFQFASVICSDLTNMDLRSSLRGKIDALFVLEWNRDTDGFSSLVQASSTDLHAFIIQVNNRLYGDSWVRGPFCESYERDILRVKGGSEDYVVLGSIPFQHLREFQYGAPRTPCEDQRRANREAATLGAPTKRTFKPVPTGYVQDLSRRP